MVNVDSPARVGLVWFAALACGFFALTAAASETCDRKSFGSWQQINYEDTRYRVLKQFAIGDMPDHTNKSGKRIADIGTWVDAYSGELYVEIDASLVEVDHVIPICWAWRHGAEYWGDDLKRAFYNDTRFLRVVGRHLNRKKSDNGLDEFFPAQSGACVYVTQFLQGVDEYGLVLSTEERQTFQESRREACDFRAAESA